MCLYSDLGPCPSTGINCLKRFIPTVSLGNTTPPTTLLTNQRAGKQPGTVSTWAGPYRQGRFVIGGRAFLDVNAAIHKNLQHPLCIYFMG